MDRETTCHKQMYSKYNALIFCTEYKERLCFCTHKWWSIVRFSFHWLKTEVKHIIPLILYVILHLLGCGLGSVLIDDIPVILLSQNIHSAVLLVS